MRTHPTQHSTVALLFLGSGCAALVYEVVWFHLLRLVIGASALSIGVLLANFMGGMCLGSALYPRLAPKRIHPLRMYALLEFGIATFGLALPRWLPSLMDAYGAQLAPGEAAIAWRAAVAGVCLLPPTVLMGATLPAIARWVSATPDGLARLGVFYGVNTVGAVLGCLIAGFVLMPLSDVHSATWFATAINVTVGVFALLLSARYAFDADETEEPSGRLPAASPASLAVLVAIGVTGMVALGAEVVWTRLLSLQFGVTVYAFSILLAVFLAGIGFGGVLGAWLGKRVRHPVTWLGLCQIALAALMAYSAFAIVNLVPYWERPLVYTTAATPQVFLHDSLRAAVAVLPPSLLWGVCFSLAVVAHRGRETDASRVVARVYATNTLGAILGALGASAWLIPTLGVTATQRLLIGASAASGLLLLALGLGRELRFVGARRWGPLAAAAAIGAIAVATTAPPPPGMLAWSREPRRWRQKHEVLYQQEGVNTPVVVDERRGRRLLHVSGKVVASNAPEDIRIERMLAHVPALLHGAPEETLTVGLGTGTTAGGFCLYPAITAIDVCELEPAVLGAAAKFAVENNGVVHDSRATFYFDDARHFLVATTKQYDVITSDPIHPWVRGASALYSEEYYQLVKRRLKPGGVAAQWIPLYETDIDAVRCQLATFNDAFPGALYFTSTKTRRDGYDLVAIGRPDGGPIDLAEFAQRMVDHPAAAEALGEIGLGTPTTFFGRLVGYGPQLKPWLADAQRNRDDSLRLQYLAGLSVLVNQENRIIRELVSRFDYPTPLLISHGDDRAELETLWDAAPPSAGVKLAPP